MSSVQVRVLALFSVGYFVSYVFRGVNLGFAPFVTHELGLSAADLGLHHSTVQTRVADLSTTLGFDLRTTPGRHRLALGLSLYRLAHTRF